MAGLVNTFGAGAMTNSIDEIRDADFLLVIGSNTSEAHPIIAMEMKRAVRRGATLVVADPRAIWMANIADRHLKIRPGSDVWLLNAMAHVIVTENLMNQGFIDSNTENFEAIKEVVLRYSPEEAEKHTDIPAEEIRKTARQYATTEKAGIYYTLGITEHTHGTDNVYGLSNLVLMTGHLGFASCGMNPLRGQNNVQGANDAGATPVFYPGYQRAEEEETVAKYEASWKTKLPRNKGLNLNEMMKVAGDTIRGLYVMGEDILLSEPNVSKLEERMNGIEFVVVQDIFLNETCRFADVVLPAACFAEKEGVFTNSERRVQRVRQAVKPPGNARADWQIIVDVANACGADWNYESASDVFAELAKDAPRFAGINHDRLEKGGLQWPCTTLDDPGTRYLHKGGILRGKGKFEPIEFRPPSEPTDDDYPLVLSTGRTLYHYNAATQTRRASGLSEKQPMAHVEIHPKDAKKRKINHEDPVDVRTRRGKISAIAILSRQVRRGSVWIPLHFAEARANLLTVDAGDAVTGTAEYKVCAAQVDLAKEGAKKASFPGSYYATEGPGPDVESSCTHE